MGMEPSFTQCLANLRSFKFAAHYPGLPDDRLQRADPDFRVVRHRNGDGRVRQPLLHHDMAAAPPHFDETVPYQNCANRFTGQNAQLSQPPPRGG